MPLRRALAPGRAALSGRGLELLDLLDAQRSLFVAELELADAQGQEATAAVTLYRALGGGLAGKSPRIQLDRHDLPTHSGISGYLWPRSFNSELGRTTSVLSPQSFTRY
jgi:hypothetical protein